MIIQMLNFTPGVSLRPPAWKLWWWKSGGHLLQGPSLRSSVSHSPARVIDEGGAGEGQGARMKEQQGSYSIASAVT